MKLPLFEGLYINTISLDNIGTTISDIKAYLSSQQAIVTMLETYHNTNSDHIKKIYVDYTGIYIRSDHVAEIQKILDVAVIDENDFLDIDE